jgi:hypothetical protein
VNKDALLKKIRTQGFCQRQLPLLKTHRFLREPAEVVTHIQKLIDCEMERFKIIMRRANHGQLTQLIASS